MEVEYELAVRLGLPLNDDSKYKILNLEIFDGIDLQNTKNIKDLYGGAKNIREIPESKKISNSLLRRIINNGFTVYLPFRLTPPISERLAHGYRAEVSAARRK